MERLQTEREMMTLTDYYPGYPADRLTLTVEPNGPLGGIEIPDGSWTMNNSPLPSFEQSLQFIDAGYEIDSLGRPLHPWAKAMLANQQKGVVTGKGAYWHWGPNATADSIVITKEDRPRILLITRSDTGMLALPGGYLDGNEDPATAARRELHEETGLELQENATLIYQGPVEDLRTTLHAWPETSAYLFRTDAPTFVEGLDDARDARWYYLDELSEPLFGSHGELVAKALETLRNNDAPSFRDILALPEDQRTTMVVQAGHMAYNHYITEHPLARMFVKEHDPTRFTDSQREAHSRAYLTKEHQAYAHLQRHHFSPIPERVELIDDALLAMDLLAPSDGWHWRAPRENIERYQADALTAFEALQATPPAEQFDHEAIAPTYETFWREGWDAIDDTTLEQIRDKIALFGSAWSEDRRATAAELADSLVELRSKALSLARDVPLYPAHNDARQSNIAWHPDYGIKLVDWSWADVAPKNADATMFLIDLAKSGHEIEQHKEAINPDYALTLIGFWLAHSIWQTRDGSTTVREHQVASATTAFQLLQSLYQ